MGSGPARSNLKNYMSVIIGFRTNVCLTRTKVALTGLKSSQSLDRMDYMFRPG